jgi:hypothetical protein
MLGRDMYNKWIMHSGYSITYKEWEQVWKSIRNAFFEAVTTHPSGVDLPLLMGNISIKILDSDFKCAKDFLHSAYRPKSGEEYARRPYITIDTPKRAKITWKKHKLFMGIPATMGLQAAETFKTAVSRAVRGKTERYQKMEKYGSKKSKCEDIPEKGLFDN